jgi:hypothetical protein
MFQNILKWKFKIVLGDVEKEINVHLDPDTPLYAVEQVAMQMIAHCTKIKDAEAARISAEQSAETVDSQVGYESNTG